MKNVIYIIKNTLNNKRYVGSTKCFVTRKNRHIKTLMNNSHHNIYLQRSFNKHGIDIFEFIIIEENVDDLFKREIFWINSFNPEYNIGSVGGGDNISKHPNLDQLKEKWSISSKNRFIEMSQQEKKDFCDSITGSKNPNWKGGISQSFCTCGNKKTKSAKKCTNCVDKTGKRNPFFNKTHSEKTKNKISIANKGRLPINSKKIIANGNEYESLSQAAKFFGITSGAMHNRVNSSKIRWKNFYYKKV